MGQKRPGVVAEAPRAQRAPIDLLARIGSRGPVNARRAVERPIPVVATTRSKILPLSAFDALRYWTCSLLVTCRLAAISILPSTSGKPSRPYAQSR